MRPLQHPAVDDLTVESILHALSDRTRVDIFAALVNSSSARTCTKAMAISEKVIPKSTLSQHFKILREAGLIYSERSGIEMRNTTRCEEVDKRFPGLIHTILSAYFVKNTASLNISPQE